MPDLEVPDVVRRVAEEVLFPAALKTEAADTLAVEQLDILAGAGLYGLAGPVEAGGMGLDLQGACNAIEVMAGACLTTTFVWVQHHGAVLAVGFAGPEPLREQWLEPLCRGERRAGVALAGMLPGPPQLVAHPTADGWRIEGTSPWVTGWGLFDVLLVAARDPEGENVLWLLADVPPSAPLTPEPLRMVSLNATATVALHFDGLVVRADRLVRTVPFSDGEGGDVARLRVNGSLALGVAGRCCSLIGPSPLDDQLAACRGALDELSPETMSAARARAAELAFRAAGMAIVTQGSRSILVDQHPQRLAREALFLLVFAQRPSIRAALGDVLSRG